MSTKKSKVNTITRKGYREFFLNQLSSPKSRKDLQSAFLKKYPQDTATMTADEKAEREVNRYLYFFKKENILKSQADKGSSRHAKLFYINKNDIQKALSSKPAPRKSTPVKKTSRPASKKSNNKKSSAVSKAKGAVKKAAKKFFLV